MTKYRWLIVSLFLVTVNAAAQPFASGLQLPSKITFTPRGHLLVAENGTGPNLGRISVVNRNTGQRRTLIGGLPAGINTAEGQPAPSGPSGVLVVGNTLYVTIGQGDAVLAGTAPGSQIPNPTPASQLLSSVLEFVPNKALDDIPGELVLTPDQLLGVRAGAHITLGNGQNFFTVRMVANFDDYRAEPRPDFPANVRASNPYGLTMIGDTLYIADSGWNSVRTVRISSTSVATLMTFPPIANPTPVGAPGIDAVPDSIRADGDRLLVTLLTGFPFVPGLSRAVAVDRTTGAVTTIVDNLNSAIDIVRVGDAYVVSEFSTNLIGGAPGRILLVRGEARTTLADNIVSPSSIAVDTRTGELFVAQIFPGLIVRFDVSAQLPEVDPESIVPVVGSVAGAFGSRFETSLQIANPHAFAISGVLVVREPEETHRFVYQLAPHETRNFGNLMAAVDAAGIATMDIEPAVGPAPVAVARIFDTSHSTMSTGTVIAQLTPDDALRPGEHAALIAAADPLRSRTNIGLRALAAGAVVRLTLYRSNGVAAGSVELPVEPNQLRQHSLSAIFSMPAAANDSIAIEVISGAAIAYASNVNVDTQESSFQLARRERD
jgi:hypothetical protein